MESAPLPSETETGDRGIVQIAEGRSCVTALDALGHGPEASDIAAAALDFLSRREPGVRLESVFEQCHERLRGTRGIALCLADIDMLTGEMTWLSVGNIQAVHIQLDANRIPRFAALVMRGGVVGDRLPELRASQTTLRHGDTVVFASDGIDYGWYRDFRYDTTPRELARTLITRHCDGKDDAMAMILRYQPAETSGSR